MTAKRYKEVEVLDNVIYINGEIIGCKRLCNLLNELHEENQSFEIHSKWQGEKYSELLDSFTNMKKKLQLVKKENEQLKCSNKDAWDLIQFIYNEIKEDGSMDFGRIKDLVELE